MNIVVANLGVGVVGFAVKKGFLKALRPGFPDVGFCSFGSHDRAHGESGAKVFRHSFQT